MLFDHLPEFPPALPDDELRLLQELPDWPTVQEIAPGDFPPARRLESKGLIKISRVKYDPCEIWPHWEGGKLPPSALRQVTG